MFKTQLLLAVMLLTLLGAGQQLLALEILESGYVAQTYVSVPSPDLGRLEALILDSNGNVYIAYRGTSRDVMDGGIYRITPEGTGAVFATGFYSAVDIACGSGTGFGDYLYVTDAGASSSIPGGVMKVDLATGETSVFCQSLNQPVCLEIDHVGNYNGKLFVGTSSGDRIDKVIPDGTLDRFSSYPYNIGGGSSMGITFDPGTRYGSHMYVATYSNREPTWAGVFSIDLGGSPARLTTDIASATSIEFDVVGQYFGGDLLVTGSEELGGIHNIYRVSPNGDATLFARESVYSSIGCFTLGSDGAMYIMNDSDGMLSITRIVPEPMAMVLLGTGAIALLRKRKD